MLERISQYLSQLAERPAFRNISILAIGTLIAQLINVFTTPILSRLFDARDFAQLALFTAIGTIILSFSTFRLPLAIVKSQEKEEQYGLIKVSFLSNLVMSLISALVVYFLCIGDVFEFDGWSAILFAGGIFLYVNVSGGSQILSFFLNSKNIYKPISGHRILMYLAIFLIAVLFYYLDSRNGLVIAYTGGITIAFIYLTYFIRKQVSRIRRIKIPRLKQVIKENIDFVRYATPSSLIDVLAMNAVVIFTSIYFTKEITGSFFMAEKIVYLPITLVAGAIGQVFYKNMSDKQAKNQLQKRDFLQLWKFLFLLGVGPCLLMFFFGEMVFTWVLGADWVLAGQIISIMSIRGLAGFISSPTSSGFVIIEKQGYVLIFTAIKLIYTIVLLIISWQRQDFFFFIWAYTIAEVIKTIITNMVLLHQIK